MQYLQVKWRDTNKIRACNKLIHCVHVYLLCIYKGSPPMNGTFKKVVCLSLSYLSEEKLFLKSKSGCGVVVQTCNISTLGSRSKRNSRSHSAPQ